MKTINEIDVLEVDGEDVKIGDNIKPLIVESHWNDNDQVILKWGEMNIAVDGRELIQAIKNSQNAET